MRHTETGTKCTKIDAQTHGHGGDTDTVRDTDTDTDTVTVTDADTNTDTDSDREVLHESPLLSCKGLLPALDCS